MEYIPDLRMKLSPKKKQVFFLASLVLVVLMVLIYINPPNRVEVRDTNQNGVNETFLKYQTWQLKQVEIDGDEDGNIDFWSYRGKGEIVEREELDNNWDGSVDLWVYFDEKNHPIRIEKDHDFDGVKDAPEQLETLNDELRPLHERDVDFGFNEIYHYENGHLTKYEFTIDDIPTSIISFNEKGIVIKEESFSKEGLPQVINHYDEEGYLSKEEFFIDGEWKTNDPY